MYLLRNLFAIGTAALVLSSLANLAAAVPLFQQLPQQQFRWTTPQPPAQVLPPAKILPYQESAYYWPKQQNSLWNLVGTWHGEAMIDDQLNQEVVLERCRNGLFVAVSQNCLKNGYCGQQTHVGRWHARSNVYTTQLLGEIRDDAGGLLFVEIDPNQPQAHHQFQITSLSQNSSWLPKSGNRPFPCYGET